MIDATEMTKDATAGGATMLGSVLLFITENPEYGTVLFIISFLPVIVRLYHSIKKRNEEKETHEAEMKLMELERKIKQKQLES